LEKVNLQKLDIMGWQAIGILYGFLHGIIGVVFGVLVGHVTCGAIGRVLLKTKVQFLCKLLQFTI
jgi:hypothetical protein